MSMNLALQRKKQVSFLPFQTPTAVSNAAIASGNPTAYYKDWLLTLRQGKFKAETEEHFRQLDALLAAGYRWIVV